MRQNQALAYSKVWSKKTRNHVLAYLFLVPAIASLATFKYYPFFLAFIESFFEWNGANLNRFVGMDNYRMLLQDDIFYLSLRNIGIIAVCFIATQLVFPLLASIGVSRIMNKSMQNLYKLLFIVPMVVPYVIVFLLWRWIYNGDFGVMNEFLGALGLDGLTNDWLGNRDTALGAIIFLNFPWVGTIAFLIYLAGIMAIPHDLYEVGKMEGMNGWQRLLKIELPLLANQVRLVVILSLIQQLQSFENILILTNGGPGYSTMTPAMMIYREGIEYNRLGYASATGVVVFLLILAVTILINRYMRTQNKVE